ncbi:hypothetical protein [Nannocystis punicea]|uniref:Uncharacterized protein n=1 Tax=Nannocystis punicea TaxID=2995304 RepID=A0ABY7HCX9_9BACT|nr:hypothetical protein [Nannocystis poenicansa]WAS97051.1 hypothetical protein O0S08_12960 [Nannocystis poenicansa]
MALSDAPTNELSELHALVEGALRAAQAHPTAETTRKERHKARSRHFVLALADALREHEGGDVDALSRYHDNVRPRLGTGELLHDITISRSLQLGEHWYITEVLWQVESELSLDRTDAVQDFNKLVLGSAHHKLFVASMVPEPDSLLRTLEPAAARCTGRVFMALIPHPDHWDGDTAGGVRTWQFRR